MSHHVNNILVFLFIAVWIAATIASGIPALYEVLGGSCGFYFLLPLIVCLNLKYNSNIKIIWSIIFTIIGIVTVNYSYTFFYNKPKDFTLIITAYIYFIPLYLIAIGFLATVLSIFKKKEQIDQTKDKDALRYFYGFMASVFIVPILIVIPVLDLFKAENIIVAGYQIGFASFIFGCIIFLSKSRKISTETLNYFSKTFEKYSVDTTKIKRRVYLVALGIISFSSILEIHRGHWVIWSESVVIFLSYIVLLSMFCQIIFIPNTFSSSVYSNKYLPSIKNKKAILLGVILVVSYIIMLITALIIRT